MGCKEGDAIVRTTADFEVSDVLVCLPSIIFFYKTQDLTSLLSFAGLLIFDDNC